MTPATLRQAFLKQRQINRRLQQQLRVETLLTNALSDLRWHKHHQTPAAIERLRAALDLKQAITEGKPTTRPYPSRQAA
jgi:hypothetical protein